jgi:diaminopimelate epimerase
MKHHVDAFCGGIDHRNQQWQGNLGRRGIDMDFWKLQGSGNDFILIDNRDGGAGDLSAVAKASCHRHFGVGADGLMAVESSSIADIRMVYYNSDGSPAAMCGNGIRCFAKFVKDSRILLKDSFLVETGDGVKQINILTQSEKISQVQVDMGSHGEIRKIAIPASDTGLEQEIELIFMHIGVPHSVIFIKDVLPSSGEADLAFSSELIELTERLGPLIEKHPAFLAGTNVNFVQVNEGIELSAGLTVNTWERGAGRTLACGTGACAAAVAALWAGAIRPRQRGDGASGIAVHVRMPGGEVTVAFAATDAFAQAKKEEKAAAPAAAASKAEKKEMKKAAAPAAAAASKK